MDKNGEKSRDDLIEEIKSLNERIGELEGLEKKLKESESRLEFAQRVAHVGNWTWDIVRDNCFGSQEAYRIFEIPPGTPVTMEELIDMVHPEDRPMAKEALEDGLRGAVYKMELRIISRTGWLKHIQTIGELESRDGRPVALNGTIQDITERKELANEQKRLIGQLQYAQRTAHLGNWVWDIAGDNFFGSQESYNIFDLSLGTPISYAKLMEMVHQDDRAMVKSALDEALKGGIYKQEFRIISGKGHLKHLQGIAELESRNGMPIALRGTIQDITEKKELENKQAKLISELEYAQRTAHLGDWTWDIVTNNFFGSRESYNIFDLPVGTPVHYDDLMNMVLPEDRLLIKKCLDEALNGLHYEVEFRITTGQGRRKYLHGIGELERKEGKAVIGTIQDITEKKELENGQKKLIGELQEALTKIKTLSGLLPVCANCKRIRDDKGRWFKMEKYIEQHSEAEFTHSICPDCEEKLYGKEKE